MTRPLEHHRTNSIDDRQPGRRGARRVIVALAAALALLAGLATAASGDGNTRGHVVRISGDSTPSDCNDGEGAGALALTGDLEGCLTFFPTRFTCRELNGFARYREWGTETFVGTLHGEPGTFETTYKIDSTYTSGSCAEFEAGGFPFENQLTGGCRHRVIGQTGAFEGQHGLIEFFDVIPDPGQSGASNFLYVGRLRD